MAKPGRRYITAILLLIMVLAIFAATILQRL